MRRKIDVHTHVGEEPSRNKSCRVEERLADMAKHNVKHSVVFPFGEGDLVRSSTELLRQCQDKPELIPFLRINPKLTTEDQLHSLLAMGFRGVKLHPGVQQFNPLNEDFFPLYRIIARKKIPLLIHTTKNEDLNCDPNQIVTLGYKFPELLLILGHFASSQPLTRRMMKDKKNIFVETSLYSTPFALQGWARFLGEGQLLYGTDHPFSFHELESLKIELTDLSEEEKDNIYYQNAANLFNL